MVSCKSHSTTIPVSLKNEFRKVSLRSGAAMSSAKTGAPTTRPPRERAVSKADCAAALRTGSRSQSATMTLVSMAVVISPASPCRTINCLLAGGDSRVSDCPIFCKWALRPHGPYSDSFFIALKDQPVAGANPQHATDLVRHCDLSLAGDSRLLLHIATSNIPYLITDLLTWTREVEAPLITRKRDLWPSQNQIAAVSLIGREGCCVPSPCAGRGRPLTTSQQHQS